MISSKIRVAKYNKSFFISCPVGLEGVLEKEIESLGESKRLKVRGGVEFKSESIVALKSILHSRVGSRVYKKLYSFPVSQNQDIYNVSKNLPWSTTFTVSNTFKIKTLLGYGLKNLKDNTFSNSIYLSQLLKDGICDYFRKNFNGRPSVDKEDPFISFLLRISLEKDLPIASIYQDLSGDPLHNRGYRVKSGKAPLRENLAAGIILSMDLDLKREAFIDSMCGSGTFLIEASLIKADIPPSYLKLFKKHKWAFEDHLFFDSNLKEEFNKEISVCISKADRGLNLLNSDKSIVGYELDPFIVKQSIVNIKFAKLNIDVFQSDATKICLTDFKGVIFCNPPYGERIGDIKKLEYLYHEYGENLKKNFKGCKAYILTGNLNLRKKISLKTSERIQLYNGNIDCRLLKYDIY